MAQRTTRNRIRHQCKEAMRNIDKAFNNLAQMAGIADGRHPKVDANVPEIAASLEMIRKVLEKLDKEL